MNKENVHEIHSRILHNRKTNRKTPKKKKKRKTPATQMNLRN